MKQPYQCTKACPSKPNSTERKHDSRIFYLVKLSLSLPLNMDWRVTSFTHLVLYMIPSSWGVENTRESKDQRFMKPLIAQIMKHSTSSKSLKVVLPLLSVAHKVASHPPHPYILLLMWDLNYAHAFNYWCPPDPPLLLLMWYINYSHALNNWCETF